MLPAQGEAWPHCKLSGVSGAAASAVLCHHCHPLQMRCEVKAPYGRNDFAVRLRNVTFSNIVAMSILQHPLSKSDDGNCSDILLIMTICYAMALTLTQLSKKLSVTTFRYLQVDCGSEDAPNQPRHVKCGMKRSHLKICEVHPRHCLIRTDLMPRLTTLELQTHYAPLCH